MSKALSRELRENCAYLREEGWQQTASLMSLAADEIDRLDQRVNQLEGGRGDRHSGDRRTVQGLVAKLISSRKR